MTDGADPKLRLAQMISSLFTFRCELSDAEFEGSELVAERAREEIQTLHAMIRRHCELHGLPRPDGVPETD